MDLICPQRLDPVCPERLDSDPVNIRPDPKPYLTKCLYSMHFNCVNLQKEKLLIILYDKRSALLISCLFSNEKEITPGRLVRDMVDSRIQFL